MDHNDRSAASLTWEFCDNDHWRNVSGLIWVGHLLVLVGILALTVGSTKDISFSRFAQGMLPLSLIVPPMVMIISAGGLDLSVGSVAALAGVLVAALMPNYSPFASVMLGLSAALCIGLVNGLLVCVLRMHGALATMGTMVVTWAIREQFRSGWRPSAETTDVLVSLAPTGWIVLFLVGISAVLLVRYTRFGRRPAPGARPEESRLARAVYVGLPYVLSSLMAGLAGLILSQQDRTSLCKDLHVFVIFAVIIGGTLVGGRFGSVVGGLLGVVFLGLVECLLSFKIKAPRDWFPTLLMAVLMGECVLCYIYFCLVRLLYRTHIARVAIAGQPDNILSDAGRAGSMQSPPPRGPRT